MEKISLKDISIIDTKIFVFVYWECFRIILTLFIIYFLPDIEPNSLELLLLPELLLLVLLIVITTWLLLSRKSIAAFSRSDCANLSSASLSILQNKVLPSRSANSSPDWCKKNVMNLQNMNNDILLTWNQLTRTCCASEAFQMKYFRFRAHHKVIFAEWVSAFITLCSKQSNVISLAVGFSVPHKACAAFV